MRRVLLDTNVLIRAVQGGLNAIKPAARAVLSDVETERILSAVSITEIVIKTNARKLSIYKVDLAQIVDDLQLTILPFTARHAMRLYDLPLHHQDPFDRMLIATALAEGIPLMSADDSFPSYTDAGLNLIRS